MIPDIYNIYITIFCYNMEKSFTVCGVKHEKAHLKCIFSAFCKSRIQNLRMSSVPKVMRMIFLKKIY